MNGNNMYTRRARRARARAIPSESVRTHFRVIHVTRSLHSSSFRVGTNKVILSMNKIMSDRPVTWATSRVVRATGAGRRRLNTWVSLVSNVRRVETRVKCWYRV